MIYRLFPYHSSSGNSKRGTQFSKLEKKYGRDKSRTHDLPMLRERATNYATRPFYKLVNVLLLQNKRIEKKPATLLQIGS